MVKAKPRKPIPRAIKNRINKGPVCLVFPVLIKIRAAMRHRDARPSAILYALVFFKVSVLNPVTMELKVFPTALDERLNYSPAK